jgi:hypothetical protein
MSILSEHRNEPRRRGGVFAALALLAVAAIAAGWLWHRRSELRPESPATAAEPAHRASPRPGSAPRRAAGGRLEVDAGVPNAVVAVDGHELGRAPRVVELPGGPHQVRLEAPGYEPYERDVHVVPGRTLHLSASLEREPPELRVDSDLPGASVFIDQRPVGRTPLATRSVAAGTHRLNVTADGYEMYSDTIELGPDGRTIMVRFKEVRLDESLAVVHKHGFGSCRGRLTATSEGLRYQTEDANDGFQIALSALAPLQVDYLKKNLRVRAKGGKTYNFTADSADALLAFQKAVEAARKRL